MGREPCGECFGSRPHVLAGKQWLRLKTFCSTVTAMCDGVVEATASLGQLCVANYSARTQSC